MMELAQANWPLFVIALVIGILVAWWILVALRRTKVDADTSDVLDDGKGPAARNQALIDAPPAAETPPVVPVPAAGVAGAGTAVAAAVQEAADRTAPAETVQESAPSGADAGADSGTDDLTRIKGVGPKLKTLLVSLGVTRFDQIAGWTEADIDSIDAQLGRFEGRIRRDNWMEQAKFLAADDTAGYEGKFGKL